MKNLMCVLLCVAISPEFVTGQDFEPRNKINVNVNAKVTQRAPGIFSYNYAITSLPESHQKVWDFSIIYQFENGLISGIESPSRWPKPMMPGGGPPFWVSWGAFGENQLKPGESQGGFGIQTTIKPGITEYYTEGYAPPPSYDQGVTDDTLHGYDNLTPYGPGIVGKTVGPVLPPSPFSSIVFLDTLLSYTHQSADLGWITNQSVADKYLGNFSTAKAQVQQNNTAGARITLQMVLRDVDVDSSSMLTSEAYALLRYNTEYLLDQLPAQPQELPFVVQVDSLSARLATSYANDWIGDKGFLNSLKKQLTDARKNLEKGNLTKASAELQDFLNRLQKVYRHTLEEQQKGKHRPKDFVTQDGFTYLAGKTAELLTKLGSLGRILSVPGQFTSIQAAVNAAKPGTIIAVDAGTYKELVEIEKMDSLSLLASEDVTIQGVHIARCNVITVKGFTIDAAGTKKDAVEIEGGENTDITIEANEIVNSSKHGISTGKRNVRTRIVNNVIAGNGQNGIDFAGGTDGAHYVLNNTIVKNGWNGVDAASQKNLYLVNNIISFNGTAKGDAEGRFGVKREGKASAGKITLLNNLIIGNNGKVSKQSSKDVANYEQVLDGADSDNITSTGGEGVGVAGSSAQSFGDVLLADYRLTETSVAIDKGIASFAAPDAEAGKLPEEDKDGNPRPQRTRIDLGAFELE